MWVLALVGLVAGLQWWVSGGGDALRTEVLGAQAKKPDVTPPTVSVSFPAAGGVYGPNTWTGTVTGSASDDTSGVKLVEVKVDNGAWATASGTTSWSKAVAMPAPGTHTVSVQATDGATPSANISNPMTVTFRVDTQPPAAPTISQGPDNPTIDTSPSFTFAGEAGATFVCSLDGAAQACTSPFAYKKVSASDHSFSVVAVDAAGNRSAPSAPWAWTVLINKAFGISGDAMGPLYPGMAATPLNLKITNPYNFAIRVVGIDVSTVPAGACGTDNLTIQSLAATHSTAIVVPANSTAMLDDLHPGSPWPGDWPTIAMKNNTSVNQDGCKAVTFKLSYTGTATKP
jgi:hypothetical protein